MLASSSASLKAPHGFEGVLSIVVIACDRGVYLDERGEIADSIGEAINLSISVAAPEISAFELPCLPRMTDNERAKFNFLGSGISPQASAELVGRARRGRNQPPDKNG